MSGSECNKPFRFDACYGVQAKNILIATGSFASKIPIDGAEHGITSDEVLNLEQLPEK